MCNIQVGDTVRYKFDHKQNRKWYVLDVYDNLCRIVIMRNDSYKHLKNNEEYLNANITNLNIEDIEKYE